MLPECVAHTRTHARLLDNHDCQRMSPNRQLMLTVNIHIKATHTISYFESRPESLNAILYYF